MDSKTPISHYGAHQSSTQPSNASTFSMAMDGVSEAQCLCYWFFGRNFTRFSKKKGKRFKVPTKAGKKNIGLNLPSLIFFLWIWISRQIWSCEKRFGAICKCSYGQHWLTDPWGSSLPYPLGMPLGWLRGCSRPLGKWENYHPSREFFFCVHLPPLLLGFNLLLIPWS